MRAGFFLLSFYEFLPVKIVGWQFCGVSCNIHQLLSS